jgi:rare lipoprotein A
MVRRLGWVLISALILCASGCAARSKVGSSPAILESKDGFASFYGQRFNGNRTASGAQFDMHAMVAAHPTYPFGTIVRVTNLQNKRSVQVQILDRGPGPGPRSEGVLIDLSYGAARALDFVRAGRTRVRLEVLRWGN